MSAVQEKRKPNKRFPHKEISHKLRMSPALLQLRDTSYTQILPVWRIITQPLYCDPYAVPEL